MNVYKRIAGLGMLAIGCAGAAPAHAQFDLLRKLVPQVQAAGDMVRGQKQAARIYAIQRLAASGNLAEALRRADELVAENRGQAQDAPGSAGAQLRAQSVSMAADLHERSGNYARAIELHQSLLGAQAAGLRRPGTPGQLALRFRIGQLQEKSGDLAAAIASYRQLLAAPESALPFNQALRVRLYAQLGHAALRAGDDALAEANLLLALRDDPTYAAPASSSAPGAAPTLFEVNAILQSAATRVAELRTAIAADHVIMDSNGELVMGADPADGERGGVLAVEGVWADLATLYHRRRDAPALRVLYLSKFGDYAERSAGVAGAAFGPSAQLEKEYARFGAYFVALRQDQLADQAFGHALRLNALRLKLAAVTVPPELLAASFATRRQILDLVLSYRLAQRAGAARWRSTLGDLLQSKGLQSEFLARRARAIGLATDPEVRRLAAAMAAADAADDAAARAHRYVDRGNMAVALQARVGKLLPPLVFDDGERFLDQVQQRLGTETLVSVSAFMRFDFDTQQFVGQHYLGARISREAVQAADLGPGATLDALGAALRADLARAPKAGAALGPLRSARAMYGALLEPLLGGRAPKAAYVADLDGALSLVPLEALADGGGRYLIEDGEWRYLSSARALLRAAAPRGAAGQAVVLADPAYDAPGAAAPAAGLARRGGAALQTLRFAPLPHALEEGNAVAAALRRSGSQVEFHTGAEANLHALNRLRSPRYLHIATHGFFNEEAGIRREQATGADGRRYVAESYAAGRSSGLALAGANATLAAGAGDGVIYAAQLRQLDLADTELAVLSACDTSVGAVRPGEGVDSLRQALEVAGARSMVTSLWPVPDLETRALMTLFYDGLAGGASKPGALRQAKLRIKQRQAHPFYWASFVVTGMR